MLRALAKTSVATGLNWSGVDRLLGASMGIDSVPLVLCYHRVVRNYVQSSRHSIHSILVSTETFERQLDWIGEHYDFVSVDELSAAYGHTPGRGENRRAKPVAAVTFDDGYADIYENAFPILSRKGIPSAVFVVTDTIGTDLLQLHDELYLRLANMPIVQKSGAARTPQDLIRHMNLTPLRELQLGALLVKTNDPFEVTRIYIENLSQAEAISALKTLRIWHTLPEDLLRGHKSMSWEMLKTIAGQGVTVGSHTSSHTLLAGETPEKVMQQLCESRQILEAKLGIPIRHFAYPDGSFDDAAVESVAKAQYMSAFTTCMHSDDRYPLLTIPRRVMWENSCTDSFGRFSPAILSCQVNGIFDPARRCQRRHDKK